ncbi:MAG: alpha/beta hydrolase, partial [Gammaproteobacteria bacterium]
MRSEKVVMQTKEDVKIWSESFGDKSNPALLLIMGAMNQSVFWPKEFCEELAKSGYYVIRYDHRDTGKSDGIDYQKNPYDLTVMKNDALSVLNAHHTKEATVVGLSMGGYISQLLAVENPEKVSRLVLISTSADHRPYMEATMGLPITSSPLPTPAKYFLDYIK